MKKKAQRAFSIVKAVKLNARTRLGAPPPEKVLPDPKAKAARAPRHKQTLADMLEKARGAEEK
jgi:hypothetical protein